MDLFDDLPEPTQSAGEARFQSPETEDRGAKRKHETCHEKKVEELKWEEKKVCKGFQHSQSKVFPITGYLITSFKQRKVI